MTTFDERVKEIADAENDVDKVLKAARLERNPMSYRKMELIMDTVIFTLAIGMPMAFLIIMFLIMQCKG